MKHYIEIYEYPFDNVKDPVKTEQNIFELITKNKIDLKDKIYVGLPLADLINKYGVSAAQTFLNKLEEKINKHKIYTCQHIHVGHLNFFKNTVFTPHTTKFDHFKPIPHYNLYFNKSDYIEHNERQHLFSFYGCFKTHLTRSELKAIETKDTPIVDTDSWHFYKNDQEKNTNSATYRLAMRNTKFSLCPPGTGASTIRLYESMSVGSIPVVFNDVQVPKIVEKYIINYDIKDIKKLPEFLNSFKNAEKISKELFETYWKYLCNNSLHKYIESNV
jgi:hypothetical protein